MAKTISIKERIAQLETVQDVVEDLERSRNWASDTVKGYDTRIEAGEELQEYELRYREKQMAQIGIYQECIDFLTDKYSK